MQKSAYEIPLALGKDILGEAQVIDLVQTPHLLIGGATNSGKSVLVNSIICSILFRRSPDEVRLFLIDPKIVELKLYNGCPHLLTPVITDPKKAFQALQYCISEMERRYTLLDALGVRDIRSFNKKAKKERVQRLPYIVIVIDEFADLMATTGQGAGVHPCAPGRHGACRGHPHGAGHAAALHRRDHRAHQGEHPVAHRLHGGQQVRLPHHRGRGRRGEAPRQGRHALLRRVEPVPRPHPGRLHRRRRDRRGHRVREEARPAPVHRGRGLLRRGRHQRLRGRARQRSPVRAGDGDRHGPGQGLRLVPPAAAEGRLQPRRAAGGRDGRCAGIVGPAQGSKPREILHVPK